MATTNPIRLPRELSTGKAIAKLPKFYSGGTNLFKGPVSKFLNAGDGYLWGDIVLPSSLDNTAATKIVMLLSTPVAGAVGEKLRLEVAIHKKSSTSNSDTDQAAWTQTVNASHAVNTWLAKKLYAVEFVFTNSNFVALEHIEYYLARYPTHVDDNHAQDVLLHGAYLLCNF